MTIVAARKKMQQVDLALLSASRTISELLLPEGRYFGQDGDTYRVALPSQNVRHAASYMSSARKKMKRAELLLAGTPVAARDKTDRTSARVAMATARAERMESRL